MGKQRYFFVFIAVACSQLFQQSCNEPGLPLPDSELRSPGADGLAAVMNEADLSEDAMTGVLPNGTYKLVSWVTWDDGTNKTVSVTGSSTADQARIEQRDYKVNTGQEWTINSLGNGEYSVINVNSGKALDVPFGVPNPGVHLWQYPYNGNNAQRWQITYVGYGVYHIKSKLNTSLGLNVEAGATANGARITLNALTNNNSFFIIYRIAYKDKVATDFFRRTTGWVAGDGAFSVPLSDGRTLWNFGDAYANNYSNGTVPCLFNVRSIAMLQPSDNWSWPQTSTLLSPTGSTLYKSNPASGYFNWPVSGVQLGDTVYTYTLNLRHIPGGWERAGPDQWAKIKFPEMTNAVTYTTLQDFGDIAFGDGLVKETDGFVYMYGKRPSPNWPGIEQDLFVARFPQSNPSAAWTFWNGSAWVSDVAQAAVIGQAPSYSLHISKVNNKYLLVSTEFSLGCDVNNPDPPRDIYAATSNSITGPFSEPKLIYRIDDELNGYYPFFYAGLAHPQFINANNELLITYSINGYANFDPDQPPCVETCIAGRMDPDITYRPRGIRVPLKLIDPTF